MPSRTRAALSAHVLLTHAETYAALRPGEMSQYSSTNAFSSTLLVFMWVSRSRAVIVGGGIRAWVRDQEHFCVSRRYLYSFVSLRTLTLIRQYGRVTGKHELLCDFSLVRRGKRTGHSIVVLRHDSSR
jgi:hypothetical protein